MRENACRGDHKQIHIVTNNLLDLLEFLDLRLAEHGEDVGRCAGRAGLLLGLAECLPRGAVSYSARTARSRRNEP